MNPAAAVAALIASGLTVADIAADLAVTRSAVYRWRAGTRNPNPRNADALRALADNRLSTSALGHRERAAASRAVDLLMTAQERAELAWLAQSIARTMREPVVSITRHADPFALLADPFADQLDALFPIAA